VSKRTVTIRVTVEDEEDTFFSTNVSTLLMDENTKNPEGIIANAAKLTGQRAWFGKLQPTSVKEGGRA